MDIALILSEKYPGQEWHLIGDDYSGLNWLSETKKPTKAELESLWTEVENDIKQRAQAKIDSRLSALLKLTALGLTQEEIDSL